MLKAGRKLRRTAATLHRSIALTAGLVLVLFATAGALLLFRPDIQRVMNPAASTVERLPGDHSVTLVGALRAVEQAHPRFHAGRIWSDGKVLRVYDTGRTHWWSVDPGSGRLLGHDGTALDGFWGLLVNVHTCGLTCKQYPGYVAWMAMPLFGSDLTLEMVLYTVVLLTVLALAASGLWLGLASLRTALRVRWSRRGSFARNSDLHRVVGLVMGPFLVAWAITGAGFVLPPVATLWYALTPGDQPKAIPTPQPGPPGPDIGLQKALDNAQHLVGPGHPAVLAVLPTGSERTYQFRFEAAPLTYGDVTDGFRAQVDRYTGSASFQNNPPDSPAATVLWENWRYPIHSGIVAQGWWRLPWLLVGLAPLTLALTGLSGWLFRRRVRAATAARRARPAA